MIQVYLARKTTIIFSKVKKAVIKTYSRIERVSSFDIMKDSKSITMNTQAEVNHEIKIFFKELRVQSQNFHAQSATDSTYTKSLSTDELKSYTNLREDFYCHNCIKQSHMSDSCSELKVVYKQRMNNRRKIDELLAKNTGETALTTSTQSSAENILDIISENVDRVMNS